MSMGCLAQPEWSPCIHLPFHPPFDVGLKGQLQLACLLFQMLTWPLFMFNQPFAVGVVDEEVERGVGAHKDVGEADYDVARGQRISLKMRPCCTRTGLNLGKRFLNNFLGVPPAWRLQNNCGTLKKHFTKPCIQFPRNRPSQYSTTRIIRFIAYYRAPLKGGPQFA